MASVQGLRAEDSLAALSGVTPLPASSGKVERYRLTTRSGGRGGQGFVLALAAAGALSGAILLGPAAMFGVAASTRASGCAAVAAAG